jgi:hypothetical protein
MDAMPTGEPPRMASQVVRRSPSAASQPAMRASKEGSSPSLHSERSERQRQL